MIDLKRYWWPVATADELAKGKPLARTLHDTPLVLFLDDTGQSAALLDRCPHRHAPLSQGQVAQGQITCPYHGWRFDQHGTCTRIPGMVITTPRAGVIPSLPVITQSGLVWVTLNASGTTRASQNASHPDATDCFFITDTVNCTIEEAAENFLDGFHTHFVHAGWIRRDKQRQTVTATVRKIPDGIEARYSSEGLQSGFISKVLEGSRTESYGRFLLPGVAEIEYRGKKGLNLLITAWLTPESDQRIRVHARVLTRKGLTPVWLKNFVLRRLFRVILSQDKAILEATRRNKNRFVQTPDDTLPAGLDTPLDLLGPAIRDLLKGKPVDSRAERTLVSEL